MMKNIEMKQIAYRLLALLVLSIVVVSCGKSDIDPYSSKRKLWFTQKVDNTVVNDVVRSFSHHPVATTLRVPFQLNLIGAIPSADLAYSVVVVDSLTTASTEA